MTTSKEIYENTDNDNDKIDELSDHKKFDKDDEGKTSRLKKFLSSEKLRISVNILDNILILYLTTNPNYIKYYLAYITPLNIIHNYLFSHNKLSKELMIDTINTSFMGALLYRYQYFFNFWTFSSTVLNIYKDFKRRNLKINILSYLLGIPIDKIKQT